MCVSQPLLVASGKASNRHMQLLLCIHTPSQPTHSPAHTTHTTAGRRALRQRRGRGRHRLGGRRHRSRPLWARHPQLQHRRACVSVTAGACVRCVCVRACVLVFTSVCACGWGGPGASAGSHRARDASTYLFALPEDGVLEGTNQLKLVAAGGLLCYPAGRAAALNPPPSRSPTYYNPLPFHPQATSSAIQRAARGGNTAAATAVGQSNAASTQIRTSFGPSNGRR